LERVGLPRPPAAFPQRQTDKFAGVTSDLKGRIWQHKEKLVKSFTKRYNINKLVYFEATNDVMSAIEREKQIKAGFVITGFYEDR